MGGRSLECSSDARRNTEPCALFQLRLDSNSVESNDENLQTTTHDYTTKIDDKSKEPLNNYKRSPCTFKTVIRVYHSETGLSKSQGHTNAVQSAQDDTLSTDSHELTDELLKNFEMSKISHI